MHLVTSSLLLHSLVNVLTPGSAATLLRVYFTLSLVWYIARGAAPIPISDFYNAVSSVPNPPVAAPQSVAQTLPPQNAPNAWHPIIQTTIVHPDDHLCKIQRALLHFAEVYGGAPRGTFASQGFDTLDGTLFLRVAGLTADRLGWMREGQAQRGWDRAGFYKNDF